jgi:uncharacterized protein with NRDE domain
MCLLAILFRTHPDAPLVVAANRDELLARPAVAMEVLRPESPRILGGRDLLAGGTWLAVNEHGVVAGLTNRIEAGRDPSRRSRGELPLRLAMHARAEDAARALAEEARPGDYNACWILVGDRDALYYLEVGPGRIAARPLGPGIHVLENRPLEAPSPKADAVRAALAGSSAWRGDELIERLHAVLRSHVVPTGPGAGDGGRPAETEAACVHGEGYGTRSSEIVVVPPDPASPPAIRYTAGPPCTSPLVAARWRD